MKYLALVVYPLLLIQEASACYKCGVSYADPHINTFDQNKFQCQGQGDFILSKSLNTDFELQGRFYIPESGLHSGRNGSATVGAVLNTGYPGEATIEVQVTPPGFPASSEHDCDIHYWVNGIRKEFNNWDATDSENNFTFKRRTRSHINPETGQRYPINFRQFHMLESKVILWMSKGFDPVFGCHMNFQACVPCDFHKKHDLVGLFGSPNGDKTDDFTTRSGEHIDQPPKLGAQTTYCKSNWCVGETKNSQFLNPDIREQCTADEKTNLDDLVENADDEIKRECEGEVDCITDSIVTGDIEIGKKTLEGERDLIEHDIEEDCEPTDNDKVEEDDAYTCTKAGVGSETAFARPDNGEGCFLDDGFKRWGWTLELDGTTSGSYTYDVYAAAGQCDIGKGEVVGTVTVAYDATSQECVGEYQATGGHTVQEWQFYCGGDKYPMNKLTGKGTVAPGMYSCISAETETPFSDTCIVENVQPAKGKIFAIAHAVSCDKLDFGRGPGTPPPTSHPTLAPTQPEPELENPVSCGGHHAAACAECPITPSGGWAGKAWCNGECVWSNDECVDKPEEPKKTFPPLPTIKTKDSDVNCGGHVASTCHKCPIGADGEWKGEAQCNGECYWSNNQCVKAEKDIVTVSCGGHRAASCGECPNGHTGWHGKNWCNGECAWSNDQCVSKDDANSFNAPPKRQPKDTDVSCGGHAASTCEECPIGPDGKWYGKSYCNGDCHWEGGQCFSKPDGFKAPPKITKKKQIKTVTKTPAAPDQLTAADKSSKKAFTKGDPHFKTFGGEMYDYHGECDLVLLHNPDFKDGLGMDIHIRTKIEAFWSSVESAVIQLGDETMEIRANPQSKEWLWFDGQEVTDLIDGKWNQHQLAGFLVRYKQTGPNTREANLYLGGPKEVLIMKTFKSFVRVDINFEGSDNYYNSLGLLGSHAHNGKRLGRDGETFIEDFNDFGQEWQVRPEVDGNLFHSYEGAIVGKKCVLPPAYHKGDAPTSVTGLRGRRLGESTLDSALVEKACSHLADPEERSACEYDVIATQDLNMASAW